MAGNQYELRKHREGIMSESTMNLGEFYSPSARANIYLVIYCIIISGGSISQTMTEVANDKDIARNRDNKKLGNFARAFLAAEGTLGERLEKTLRPDIDEKILLKMLVDDATLGVSVKALSTLARLCANKTNS